MILDEKFRFLLFLASEASDELLHIKRLSNILSQEIILEKLKEHLKIGQYGRYFEFRCLDGYTMGELDLEQVMNGVTWINPRREKHITCTADHCKWV